MPRTLHDWKAVQTYYDEGHGFVECTRRFGFTRSAWNKAFARGTLDVPRSLSDDRRRRHNWAEVQAYYDAGASIRDCRVRLGFCAVSWTKAARRGEIKPWLTVRSIVDVLKSGSSRWCKKAKLLREGYLTDRCARCGISEWRGERLVIQIDHINGVKNDWRIENLRMLCPNCHSQTETYGGRNAGRGRRLQEVNGPCSITVVTDPG
jgi:5-methylcytosine-specific restriction endonuclease McrA